jgi:prophage regulatory protein
MVAAVPARLAKYSMRAHSRAYEHREVGLEENFCDRLIDRQELRTLVPLHPTQIARLEAAGLFPRRIRIGQARVAWSLLEVLDWIEQRRVERDADVGA